MLLYSFDPHKYTKKSRELCDILTEEDCLGMGDLVERFIQLVSPDNVFYDHIVALQAPSGGGKSFFLALLYCKILNLDEYPVQYIDILDYIADDNAQHCIDDIGKLSDKDAKTSVVLLDNLDKHTSKFIYEFIHLLHRLTNQDNFLFVLAYDYNLVYSKLLAYLESEEEIEKYLQSHIHLDFLLDGKSLVFGGILDELLGDEKLEEVQAYRDIKESIKTNIIYAYDNDVMTLKQVVIVLEKLKIYIKANENATNEEIRTAFKLIILKLICKQRYIALLNEKTYQEDYKNETVEKMFIAIDGGIDQNERRGHDEEVEFISDIDIIKKMEISNV